MNLFITADRVGARSGGGQVTANELEALRSLGDETESYGAGELGAAVPSSPFDLDEALAKRLAQEVDLTRVRLAHVYAGCFTRTVELLKAAGAKVTYTAAAHDPVLSKAEHEALGYAFPFPHLTDPELWKRYLGGYLAADRVICPSEHSKMLMGSFGAESVAVIPHGVDVRIYTGQLPKRFSVGYLGQAGPDKGLRFLFDAWAKLGWNDVSLLVAGDNVDQVVPLWRRFGKGHLEVMGYVKSLADFFSRVSVYVQPSVTEGFGIEVLEAMMYGRPVVCSDGAGAADVVRKEKCGIIVPSCSAEKLAEALAELRADPVRASNLGIAGVTAVNAYSWDAIRPRYVDVWKELL